MDQDDSLRQELCQVAADLLSSRKFQHVVRRILAVPVGVWQTVAACCSDAEELPKDAAEILAEHADGFVVTHLPWPGLRVDDPGCMVVFVHCDELWSTVAYFNRASLDRDA